VALSLLFASMYCLRGTSETKNGGLAMLNSTSPAPVSSATAYSCPSVTASNR
jgi:hypothetical protein